MAVELEFVNVMLRKSAVDSQYPGGLDAFAASDLANYIEDEHLIRVGSMSDHEAAEFCERLQQFGLELPSDMEIVRPDCFPDWLEVAAFDSVWGCWLKGTEPGTLIPCIIGFILRCPRDVFRELERIVEPDNIRIGRHPGEDGYLEKLHIHRGDAFLMGDICRGATDESPVGVWVQRDHTRRRSLSAEVELAAELEAILRRHGAI